MASSGEKAPLKMTVCKDDKGVITPQQGGDKTVSLLINPAEIKLSRVTKFNETSPLGDTGKGRKFSHMIPATLSFSVVFDGTGVVPRPEKSKMPQEVDAQIETLSKIVYAYNGGKHEPNIIQIVWGTLLFTGRLKSFDIDYTLFKPSGAPLRATSSLSFDNYASTKESTLAADKNSPDLSHIVEVRAGDTLPLLCHQIYGDSRYYAAVARFNGLQQFRSLAPGMKLHFPPLE